MAVDGAESVVGRLVEAAIDARQCLKTDLLRICEGLFHSKAEAASAAPVLTRANKSGR